jgi:nitrogen fixation NifU-like protein
MHIFLKIDGAWIAQTAFLTYGCVAAIAAGSVLTSTAEGMSRAAARRLDADWLLKALGGLPDDRIHCVHLAINAFQNALDDAEEK